MSAAFRRTTIAGVKARKLVADEQCPRCGADAQQVWYEPIRERSGARAVRAGFCSSCQGRWYARYVLDLIDLRPIDGEDNDGSD